MTRSKLNPLFKIPFLSVELLRPSGSRRIEVRHWPVFAFIRSDFILLAAPLVFKSLFRLENGRFCRAVKNTTPCLYSLLTSAARHLHPLYWLRPGEGVFVGGV